MARPIRNHPVGVTGASALTLTSVLLGFGVDPTIVSGIAFGLAVLTGFVSYLSTTGGLAGLWERLIHGAPPEPPE